jgi:acyl-CoA thioester hydrolase
VIEIFKETTLRIRYGETDQMGVVYHANYVNFFEIGRTEWLRGLGFSYKQMESIGVMLPVVGINIKYSKPVFYDEVITIRTSLVKLPSAKIEFKHEIVNEEGKVVVTGESALVFVKSETRRPIKCPDYLMDRILQLS